ncbi:MAG: UDP-N-acetylglucosamine 1-carboxyvinyltransferase [Actinobacteria bacterium]|nr:UDP-N-acetylglucosamine 1-carboxyvinyltransferase [Actinomycetota bacterium]MSX81675.1 UDP-N-acetylglucosamine 1-carboxyvinyltransferase [Actinomycetota bacterium]MSZ30068.1 UDP-N-acetylglucosamine 1-carboxyvinyltransferase [Actinomycetota bacterium]
MSQVRIRPGDPLSGTLRVPGASKNSGCKQLAAALLARGTTTVTNAPTVADLEVMLDVLTAIGVKVERINADTLSIDTTAHLNPEAPYELVSLMRASINVLGPLLARCGEARVAMPGGDNIGQRKLDMHFRGLEAMGATLQVSHGFIEASCKKLIGARITLDFPSVGATENLISAAVTADGVTVIENAAREPEIRDLAAFLNQMGARIEGAGTSTIEITGVDELSSVNTELCGDRIDAGTFLMACGVAGGDITLEGIRFDQLEMVIVKLRQMGMEITVTDSGLRAQADKRLKSVDVATLPFPGFATDFMPMTVALLSVADGTSIVSENIFDSRFSFIDELNRMGSDIRTEDRHAVVRGVERLSGAPVRAFDVRAGAALAIAGLRAEGETIVHDWHHVDRGYVDLPGRLASIGADVIRL